MQNSIKNLPFLLLVLLLVACGGDAEAQTFGQATASSVLTLAMGLATPVLLVLLTKLVQVIRKKWGIDISTAQEMLLMNAVTQGIAFVEEQSRKALKDGKPPAAGAEKKIAAVGFVNDKLESLGAVEWSGEKLGKLVEAALHMQRPVDLVAEVPADEDPEA